MKICYFGFYDKDFSKNKIIINGLRKNNVKVEEKNFNPKDKLKYIKIFNFLFFKAKNYDLIFCAYPNYVPSILACLTSKLFYKIPVCLDATASYEEQEITSRIKYGKLHPKRFLIKCIDFLIFKLNTITFVESEAQKRYCIKKYAVGNERVGVIYFGADEEKFNIPNFNPQSNLVFFRGKAMNEVGFEFILKAFREIENDGLDINFEMFLAGDKKLCGEVKNLSEKLDLKNIYISDKYLPQEEIIPHMKRALVSLGQFSSNPRINKTIPYKGYESMALGIPYVTAESDAVREVMTEGKNCLFTKPDDFLSIKNAIIKIYKDREMAQQMSVNNVNKFNNNYDSENIGRTLAEFLHSVVKKSKK